MDKIRILFFKGIFFLLLVFGLSNAGYFVMIVNDYHESMIVGFMGKKIALESFLQNT